MASDFESHKIACEGIASNWQRFKCVLTISNSAGPSTAAAADYLGSVGHLAAEQTADPDAGQAAADRLAAILAQGPLSVPLDAKTSLASVTLEAVRRMKAGDGSACEGNPQEDEPGGPT